MVTVQDFRNLRTSRSDIVSGVLVALVSIPISMGYAQIAGLPAVYGLYGSLLPVLAYSLLSSSPQFIVGVDAMPAVMVGSMVAELGAGPEECLSIVPAITFLVGICLLAFRLIGAGRFIKYISNPVMGGFISGVGMTMIMMQLPKIYGGTPGTGEIVSLCENVFFQLRHFNIVSFALGTATIAAIQVSKKLIPKVPVAIIILGLGMAVSFAFRLERFGVRFLDEVPSNLPKLIFPNLRLILPNFERFLFLGITISLVIMAQTLLAGNSYAQKYDYRLDNNREILAFSMMNFAGSISGSCPINGSVSRTGLADQFGCRSQIASIVAFVVMLFVLLFCTRFFVYLPVPILAGIVISALLGIIDARQFRRLLRNDKFELAIFSAAMAGVLFLGTIHGVFLGIILSFILVIRKAVIPPCGLVGKISGQHGYYLLSRNSNSVPIKNTIIYRFGGNLFFANIDRFISDIEGSIKGDTKNVIVDASGIGDIDTTSADRLRQFCRKLSEKNIRFYLTEHQGKLNDQLRKYGADMLIEEGHVRRTISLALRDCGIEKPYLLEDGTTTSQKHYVEADEKLAEFEWAFGSDAEEKMQNLAHEMIMSITKSSDSENLKDISIEELEHRVKWGKLGLFDEEELLENFEISLEHLFETGKLNHELLNSIVHKIVKRKNFIKDKIGSLSPGARALLDEKISKVHRHMIESNPGEYQHLAELHRFIEEEDNSQ